MSEQVAAVRWMQDGSEQALTEFDDARKVAGATVTYRYPGSFEGQSTVACPMIYPSSSKALFVGHEVALIDARPIATASTDSVTASTGALRIESDHENPMKRRSIIESTPI